ncbi:transcriptional regulator [Arabiibacter massiliensis]|uniref:transcriptional regulator n=1 Tax=Arabiibacter massiliensis TaxID=1870985 RepID=UPI0009BA72C5|nr:transcriptional regulator [Arabiibacter massiliensis]
MELGSLPEWFTACAEVLAVCTALFLPQYQAYRDRKQSLSRMRRVTKGMLATLADARAAGPSTNPAQLESAQELKLYLQVSFFVLSDAREIALRDQVEQLYRQLTAPSPDIAAVRSAIAAL